MASARARSGRSNRLAGRKGLVNRYFAMRHGEAVCNVLGILAGDPEVGKGTHGLTSEGARQARDAAFGLRNDLGKSADEVIILSSDFLRAAQTAAIVREVLGTARPVRFSRALRERYFGRLEGRPHGEAKTLCAQELIGPEDKPYATESFTELLVRLTRAVVALESVYQQETILLVSHSAPLQVLEAAFAHLEPAHYERLTALKFAEIRELALLETASSTAEGHSPND